jgi:hypothetical protein
VTVEVGEVTVEVGEVTVEVGEVTVEVGEIRRDQASFPEDLDDQEPTSGAAPVQHAPPRHIDWSVRRRCA